MFLNPQKVVENWQILPGMHIADFGVGRGDFTFALSLLAGKHGVVYAVDIKKTLLESLKNKAKEKNFSNIYPIIADLEKNRATSLKEDSIHCIIVSNVLFQVIARENIVREAHRVLKQEGKVFLIEWEKEIQQNIKGKVKIGPEISLRITKEEAKKLFEIRGFSFDGFFLTGDYHYGMVFKKV